MIRFSTNKAYHFSWSQWIDYPSAAIAAISSTSVILRAYKLEQYIDNSSYAIFEKRVFNRKSSIRLPSCLLKSAYEICLRGYAMRITRFWTITSSISTTEQIDLSVHSRRESVAFSGRRNVTLQQGNGRIEPSALFCSLRDAHKADKKLEVNHTGVKSWMIRIFTLHSWFIATTLASIHSPQSIFFIFFCVASISISWCLLLL